MCDVWPVCWDDLCWNEKHQYFVCHTLWIPNIKVDYDIMCNSLSVTDSPGVPVSATSKELFRGFSYVDPTLMDEEKRLSLPGPGPQSTVHMSTVSDFI